MATDLDDDPEAPAADTPQAGIRRRPRVAGETAALPPVQIALAVFVVFLFLLILWMAWPILSGSG